MLKVALLGFYGKNNFGDSLLQDCLSIVLSAHGKCRVQTYSDCNRENVYDGRDGSFLEADIVIIGGGGLVTPHFWAFQNGGLERIIASHRPVIFLSVNVTAELTGNKVFLDKIIAMGAAWFVRDFSSVHLLSGAGIEAQFLPDVAWKSGVIGARNRELGRKVCLVFTNANALNHMFQRDNVEMFLLGNRNALALAKYLDWLTEFGWKIKFIAAQQGGAADDRIVGGVLYALMRNKQNADWSVVAQDWREIARGISNSDLVVSMRYHSTIAALAAGVPCVDITHHDKNLQPLKEMGLLNLSANYWSLNDKSLVSVTIAAEDTTAYENEIAKRRKSAQAGWNSFETEWDRLADLFDKETSCFI